jgi:hypothetical protein
VAKVYGRWFTTMLTAYTHFEIGPGGTPQPDTHIHKLPDPGLVEFVEGVIRPDITFNVWIKELG